QNEWISCFPNTLLKLWDRARIPNLPAASRKSSSSLSVAPVKRSVPRFPADGCSNPFIPPSLSPASAKNAGFHGPVLHSSRFSAEGDSIIGKSQNHHPQRRTPCQLWSSAVENQPKGPSFRCRPNHGRCLFFHNISAYLANKGRKVSMVFETADAILAVTSPRTDFIWKSRYGWYRFTHRDFSYHIPYAAVDFAPKPSSMKRLACCIRGDVIAKCSLETRA
ncbi:hypothetical protein JB92DRAFT_3284361, partial [Gautieria morchelliformis]